MPGPVTSTLSVGMFLSASLRRDDLIRHAPEDLPERPPATSTTSTTSTTPARRATPTMPTTFAAPGVGGHAVRGNVVGADTLIEALLTRGGMGRYDLCMRPAFLEPLRQMLAGYDLSHRPPNSVRVRSMSDLARADAGALGIDVLFNPLYDRGQELIGQRLRDRSDAPPAAIPVTSLIHGLSSPTIIYDWLLKVLLEGSAPYDSIVCTSRASRQAVVNILEYLSERLRDRRGIAMKYEGRCDVIPLCVDTTALRPHDKQARRRDLHLPADAFVILYIGRLSPLKADLRPFMPVLASLVAEMPRRHLLWIIAGTTEPGYELSLQECANAFGVEANVRVLLNVPDSSKPALIAAADLFFSPADSPQESFGLTPVEALACGVPQLVSDWNGYRDTVVHGETGFLIPTRWHRCHADLDDAAVLMGDKFAQFSVCQSVAVDLRQTREYLRLLIANDARRAEMAARSRRRAESEYSFEAVAARYDALWTELVSLARQNTSVSGVGGGPDVSKGFGHSRGRGRRRGPGLGLGLDRMPYDTFFLHYASSELADEARLVLTDLGVEVSRGVAGRLLSPLRLGARDVQDPALLMRVLAHLAHLARRRARVADLVRELQNDGAIPVDHLRRQVMWLIKYGYIDVD